MSAQPITPIRRRCWSTCRRRPDQFGSVLILVVWTISLLSVLAAGLGSRGLSALELTERLGQKLQASTIAAAGVQQAIRVVKDDPTPSYDGLHDRWADNAEAFAEQSFGKGTYTIRTTGTTDESETVHYGLEDEDRKLNLNTMPADVWRRLVQQVGGLREPDAAVIADSIIDWRDADHEPLPDGAESFYYLGLNTPYECKDAPFENVEELLLIKGMTPELYQRLRSFVTVYGSGRVNLNTASPTVLRALGLSESGVKGLLWYRAGEDNVEGTADDRVLVSTGAIITELGRTLPTEDLNRITQLVQQRLVTVKSEAFLVEVEAELPGAKSVIHLTSVVNRAGQILLWNER